MNNENQDAVLVIVPAYNAAKYLDKLIPRILQFVCKENLLLINDGSKDDTLEKLKLHKVNYLSYPQNRGKGAALMSGFNYAREYGYRSVLTIDADLQHLPEEIPGFFAKDDGKTVVMGTRRMDLKIMPWDRWLTNNLTSLIISIFSTARIRDSQSGYRLIPTSFLNSAPLETIKYDLESEMLFKAGAAGFSVDEVSISTIYEGSHSYINPIVDTGRFIRQIWKRIWY
jgi:glycosyltransferase involved in cell wall biosynthesis